MIRQEGVRERIRVCILKVDRYGINYKDKETGQVLSPRIDSQVATDEDTKDLRALLSYGKPEQEISKPEQEISKTEQEISKPKQEISKPKQEISKSKYSANYQFFKDKIQRYKEYSPKFAHLPATILENCILFPIEADTRDAALRIFSTLNDRGLPLSDADIFKSEFYKYYDRQGKKGTFIEEWKELEEISRSVGESGSNESLSMVELFMRYMYFLRAKERNRKTTTKALRIFYERERISIPKARQNDGGS